MMNRTLSLLVCGAIAAAVACGAGEDSDPLGSPKGEPPNANGDADGGAQNGEAALQMMSNAECLRKMALDLTNAAPSQADLDAVNANTKTLADMAGVYLATPKFASIALDWFRGTFRPTDNIPEDADIDEPARIAGYIVANDIDFRELVTGQFTVNASGTRAAAASGAGVLTTQAYLSAHLGIENRNWAGNLLVSMASVYLPPVSEVPDGVDATKAGLAGNPACSGCHTHPVYGVDRLAAYRDCHDPKGLPIAGCSQKTDLPFLGRNGRTLPDLGKILAGSVEWRATMIQTFYNHLGGRSIGKNELAQYRDFEAAWLAADYKPKALLTHMVTSKYYCSR